MSESTAARRAVGTMAMNALQQNPDLEVVHFFGPQERARRSRVSALQYPDEMVYVAPRYCTVSRERFKIGEDFGPHTWRIVARIHDAENGDTFFLAEHGFVFVEEAL